MSILYNSSDDSTSALLGEPLLVFIMTDSLEFAENSSGMLSLVDSLSSSGEDDVEIHTENTGVGIVLDSQINMLFNTESEVAY